jgi:drug/metabolite transporter (DMT)-like permease
MLGSCSVFTDFYNVEMTAALDGVTTLDGPARQLVVVRPDVYLGAVVTAEVDKASQLRGTVLVLASACCFGAISIFTIIATRTGATLTSVMLGRYAIAIVVLLLFTRGGALELARARVWPLVAVGGIGQLCVNGFGLVALRYIPAATASFLFYTYPAWVALWSALRGSERLTAGRIGALLLALAGVALMVGSPRGADFDLRGVALALAAAVSYSIYVPSINHAQRGVAPSTAATWIAIAAGCAFLIAGVIQGSIMVPHHPYAWLSMAGAGVISTVGGFMLFLRGLAILGSVRASITSTIEPFCTAILAAAILGQKLTPLTLGGGVLIALAVALLQRTGGAS